MFAVPSCRPLPKVDDWIDRELAGCHFADQRLGKRFESLVRQLSARIGEHLPLACQDWANTKAAYRFFSNARVDEQVILAGHLAATRERFAATRGPVLVLHDTTEFIYARENIAALGVLHRSRLGRVKDGRDQHRTICGILMHSSLAVTAEGLPLGLTAVKFWTRSKFKGTNALKRSVNPTRVPIEQKESMRWLENLQQSTALLGAPERCIHIGDRESDIFELFWAAEWAGTSFIFRTCVDRLAEDGRRTVAAVMGRAPVRAVHRVAVTDAKGNTRDAVLDIKYRRVRVLAPAAKQKRYGPLTLTVIEAQERAEPRGQDRIHWKLITNLPVRSRAAAIEKLDWYALRWKVETFHKILKSGCRCEQAKLRTAERLVNLLAVFCVLAWRVFWLTMLGRVAPSASPGVALSTVEVHLLDQLVRDKGQRRAAAPTLADCLSKVARLGGYLARASDPPPGTLVLWRGLSRLTDIEIGFTLRDELVGN